MTSAKIEDGAVAAADLADNAVTSIKIADATVAEADLAAGAVTTAKVANDAITSAQIVDGTIAAADLAPGVGGGVTSVNTLSGAITLEEGSNVSITTAGSALTIASSGGAGGGDITSVTAGTGLDGGGDTADVTLNLAAGGVGTAELANDAVTTAKIADGTIAAADLAAGTAVASINTLTDAVTLAAGPNVTITPAGNTLTIDAASSTGDITAVTAGTGMSGGGTDGDVTLDMAAGDVTTTEIADGTIASVDIAVDAVTTAEILDATIVTADLANDAVTTVQIADGSIAAADIAADAVTTVEILDATVGTGDLANDAVTTAKIADGTVASADIADGTIAAADMAAGASVATINTLTDAVTLAAGTNVSITPAGNTLTFAATDTDTDTNTQNTLDQAYDEGGAGSGRTITADNGAVDISGAGGLTVNGNVGVGTTTPGDKLHVIDASGTIAKFEGSGGTGPVSINDGAYSGIGTVGPSISICSRLDCKG